MEITAKSHESEIIIICDGLDEYLGNCKEIKKMFDRSNPLVYFPRLGTVVTSRPHALESIKTNGILLEIKGIVETQLDKFTGSYSQRPNSTIPKILSHFRKYPDLKKVYENPFLLMLLCFLSDNSERLPDNTTELYEKFCFQWLKKAVELDKLKCWFRRNGAVQDGKWMLEDGVQNLSKMAFEVSFPEEDGQFDRTMFNEEDMETYNVNIEDSIESGLLLYRTGNIFQCKQWDFIHRSFQDFFAAIHVKNSFDDSQSYLKTLKRFATCFTDTDSNVILLTKLRSWQKSQSQFVRFLFGLLSMDTVKLKQFFNSILEQEKESNFNFGYPNMDTLINDVFNDLKLMKRETEMKIFLKKYLENGTSISMKLTDATIKSVVISKELRLSLLDVTNKKMLCTVSNDDIQSDRLSFRFIIQRNLKDDAVRRHQILSAENYKNVDIYIPSCSKNTIIHYVTFRIDGMQNLSVFSPREMCRLAIVIPNTLKSLYLRHVEVTQEIMLSIARANLNLLIFSECKANDFEHICECVENNTISHLFFDTRSNFFQRIISRMIVKLKSLQIISVRVEYGGKAEFQRLSALIDMMISSHVPLECIEFIDVLSMFDDNDFQEFYRKLFNLKTMQIMFVTTSRKYQKQEWYYRHSTSANSFIPQVKFTQNPQRLDIETKFGYYSTLGLD